MRCLDRLEQVEVFLNNYKDCTEFRKKRISQVVYLKYHVEKYLEENYILKERLIGLLNILKKYYKNSPADTKKLTLLEELTHLNIEKILSARNSHVHENRFTDEDINFLELCDAVSRLGIRMSAFEKRFANEYSNVVTKTWKSNVKNRNKQLKKLMDSYFDCVNALVFDEKGQIKSLFHSGTVQNR